jgi:hypothetical protein
MLNLLHDRIDQQEDFDERAKELVVRVIKESLGDAVELARGDMEKALRLIATLVGEELASLTTEAVHAGFDHAVKRANIG